MVGRAARLGGVLVACASSACVPAVDLELEPPSGARVALVVFVSGAVAEDDAPAFVVDLEHGASARRAGALGSDDTAYALFFARSVEELGLDRTPIDLKLGGLADDATDRRAVPRPFASQRTVREGEQLVWADDDAPPPMHVPALDVVACASRGGCVADRGTEERDLCTIPCPPVDVAVAVAPPIAGDAIAPCLPPICEAPAPDETCALDAVWPRAGTSCASAVCPENGWPRPLPSSGVVHVRAGATSGDGSEAHPFGSIAAALPTAAGRVVAIEPGEYPEPMLTVPSGTWLMGTCPSQVQLRFAGSRGIVVAPGTVTTTISGLSISGAASGIVATDAPLVLEQVHVAGGASSAVSLAGGRLDMRGGRIHGGTFGLFAPRAQVALTNVVIDGAVTSGIDASDAALSLDDVAVRGPDGGFGSYAVRVVRSPSVRMASTELRGARGPGLLLQSDPSVVLDDVSVLDTGGARIEDSSSELRGVHLARTRGPALRFAHGTHTIDGLTIRETTRGENLVEPFQQVSGDGLVSSSFAVVRARRVHIAGCAGWAASTQAAAELAVSDGVLAGTETSSLATGLLLARTSSVSALRLELRPAARYGVYADLLSRLSLVDVTVSAVPSLGAMAGDASVYSSARSTVAARVAIEAPAGRGIELADIVDEDPNAPQRVELRDVRVRGALDGAIHSKVNSETKLTSLLLEDNVAFGLWLDPLPVFPTVVQPELTVRKIAVRGTRASPSACRDRCPDGVGVYTSSFMRTALAHVEVTESEREAVHVEGGELDLADARITRSPVGLRVVADDFDLRRVLERVQLDDVLEPLLVK